MSIREQVYKMIDKGLFIYRSPEAVFFLESPIDDEATINQVNKSSHLTYATHERANKQVITCEKDYVTLVYEIR